MGIIIQTMKFNFFAAGLVCVLSNALKIN